MNITRLSRIPRLLRYNVIRKQQACVARRYSSAQVNNSFVMGLFNGELRPEEVFPFPETMTEEQAQNTVMFIDPITRFFEEVNDAAKNDQMETVPPEVLKQLAEMGAFGMQAPVELNGLGLTNTQYARLVETAGGYDLGVGIVLGAHQSMLYDPANTDGWQLLLYDFTETQKDMSHKMDSSIGYKGILLYGTEEQKAKYIPDLAAGKRLAAYCLTEPTSGSDASSIRSRAVLSDDSKHYILNGSKIWISNGGIADVFTVFAQTPCKHPKTGEDCDQVSAFIVERSFPGVSSGKPEKKMGIKASNTAEVYFEDVKIPVENLLGEYGEGFKVAMNILNAGRFGMAAAMSGVMKRLITQTAEHVTTRVQFGSKLQEYGSVQEKVAKMAVLQYVTESMAYMISGNMDRGAREYQLEAAISKVFGSEAAWHVCDETIQLHGGMGFMTEAGLERVLRDLRIFRIFEGSNDILRLFVSLTGLQYAGGHLRELQSSLKNPIGNLGLLITEGVKRSKRIVGAKTVLSLGDYVAPSLSNEAEMLRECVTQFGMQVEAILSKYGKGILHEQFILRRLSEAAIDTYAMAVTLSRATRAINENFVTAEHEKVVTSIFCKEAYQRVLAHLASLTMSSRLSQDQKMSGIAKQVFEEGKVVATPVLKF